MLCRSRLGNNRLNGTLPAQWGSRGSFHHLTTLGLDNNGIAGMLPTLWSEPNVMHYLQEL